jgi:hypothetical protein
MARIAADGPTDRAWRAPVLLGLALVAGAFAFALLYPMVLGSCPCRGRDGRLVLVLASSRDVWIGVDAARYVANGALGFVYESNRYLTSLPLYPILLAPLVAAGDALGLSAPPAPTATMYVLLAPFTVGLATPLLHQARALVREAGGGGPLLSVQVWTALLVGVPVLLLYGHGEDALALLAVVGTVRLAGRGRWLAAGLVLGAGVAAKQWAVLALPALLAVCPRPARLRLAGAAAALPCALAGFALAVDWAHASRALLHPPNYPLYGHAALWVDAGAETVATAPFRLGVLAMAVVLAGRVGPGAPAPRLLAVLGVTLLARCALEPVLHVYYLGPGLCLLLLHERVTTGRCVRTAVYGSLLAAWFSIDPSPALWWAVAGWLGVAVALPAGRELLAGAGIAAGSAGAGRASPARDSIASGSHQ